MSKIILEIRAGAGGDEAAIFAGNLVRMYKRYAEQKNWSFTPIDANQTSLDGYKSFTAQIKGTETADALKYESGVHRVQRIPETEKQGRVHTSTASVAIMPVVEAKEVNINPGDLEISFFRSSGPGGQNVNKVETAVRILHKPTGVIVSSQAGREQNKNREMAMEILRSKLYETQIEKQSAEVSDLRRSQIGSGDRSEKIRTYNFPSDRITDHRFNVKIHGIDKVLGGELDILLDKIKKRK